MEPKKGRHLFCPPSPAIYNGFSAFWGHPKRRKQRIRPRARETMKAHPQKHEVICHVGMFRKSGAVRLLFFLSVLLRTRAHPFGEICQVTRQRSWRGVGGPICQGGGNLNCRQRNGVRTSREVPSWLRFHSRATRVSIFFRSVGLTPKLFVFFGCPYQPKRGPSINDKTRFSPEKWFKRLWRIV